MLNSGFLWPHLPITWCERTDNRENKKETCDAWILTFSIQYSLVLFFDLPRIGWEN